jgi:AraC-like DNA-binding protein
MYVERGSVMSAQNGREIVLNSGDIALYDAASPFTHDLMTESMLLLRMPRAMLTSRFGRADLVANLKIADGQPLARIIGGMIGEGLSVAPSAPPALCARFAGAMVDTLSAAMEIQFDGSDKTNRNRHERLYGDALAFIDTNIDDRDLSIELMSACLNVSPRTLSRAFASHGTTAMQQVWHRRLEISHEVLSTGRVRQVTQAAMQCGFTDLSHFCRLFKRAYGITPSTLLAEH